MKSWITNISSIKVYDLGCSRCHTYLITKDKTNILVDTSMEFERKKIILSLEKLNITNIDGIILTHIHTDHVRNTEYFRKYFNCNVYLHNKGIENLKAGFCNIPDGTSKIGKRITNLVQKIEIPFQRFDSCSEKVNDVMEMKYENLKISIMETPGHTNDSISVIVDNNVAIVGDAMVNQFGKIYPPFANEPKIIKESWNKLLKTKCEIFLPAHGSVVSRERLKIEMEKH